MSEYLFTINKGCRLIRQKKLPIERREEIRINWNLYFIEQNFTQDDVILQYKDETSNSLLYKDSPNLSIFDILYKSKGKIVRYPKSDMKTILTRVDKICYYSIYIHHQLFECDINEDRILNQCYYLCSHFFTEIETVSPEFIEKIYHEQFNKYMNKLCCNEELKPNDKTAKMFTNSTPQTISKITGEYRKDRVVEWLKEYVSEFQIKHFRTPTLLEIQFMLQKRFKESKEKIFKPLIKDNGVEKHTLYKWLDAAGIDKNVLTRKKKSLELYYEL